MRATRSAMVAALCGVLLLGSSTAWAGELLIGTEPLAVDDTGKVTAAGKAKALAELEASEPGEEVWTLHIWAKIDKPAEGPIYLEFHRDHKGERLLANRIEFGDFFGEPYIAKEVEISRSQGFRSGDTIELTFVQIVGGKDVAKAKGKIKLLASSKPAPKPDAPAADGEADPNEAREISSTPTPDAGGPPPVASRDKKGCTLGGVAPSTWLPLLGLVAIARRRSGAQQ